MGLKWVLGRGVPEVRFQELRRAPLGVEARAPDRPFDEAQVPASRGDLQLDHRVGHARDASCGNERVVRGGQEQERDAHPVDEVCAGALRVIVAGAFEAMHPRGQRVVELEERAGPTDARVVGGPRKPGELLQRLALQRAQETRAVDEAPEARTVQRLRAEREIEWNAEGGRGLDFARRGIALLAQPLHQQDRKSTRLNSSHLVISYAVFCLKKKKIYNILSDDNDIHVE